MKFVLVILAGIIAGVGLYIFMSQDADSPQAGELASSVKIGDTRVFVELADTQEKRELGLSGRSGLEENTGMLFIFDKASNHGIWMKDMKFDLDILWISPDNEVIHIKEDATPDSYPLNTFSPSDPALYVLEVNSDFIEETGVKVGDQVEFSL